MYIKNHNVFLKWEFFYKDPNGTERRMPREGYVMTVNELVGNVASQFNVFDEATDGAYTRKLKELVGDKDYMRYLQGLVEHQVCRRMEDKWKDYCWEDGLGDKLHTASKKIDNIIESFPKPLKKVAEGVISVVTSVATGKSEKALGECEKCGGTDTFDPEKDNAGRVEKINSLVPSRIPAKTRK